MQDVQNQSPDERRPWFTRGRRRHSSQVGRPDEQVSDDDEPEAALDIENEETEILEGGEEDLMRPTSMRRGRPRRRRR